MKNQHTKKAMSGSLILAGTISYIKEQIIKQIKQGIRPPGLCTIIAEYNTASNIYLHHKTHAAKLAGICIYNYTLPSNTTHNNILKIIKQENINPSIDGILIQMPLPTQLNLEKSTIIAAINPQKDIDGLHFENIGLLSINSPRFIPCTAYACIHILKLIKYDLTHKNIVIIGRSNLVGKPISQILINSNATITVCNQYTKNLKKITKKANVIISATGKPHLIKPHFIKQNTTVIDIGISTMQTENIKKIVGDVDSINALSKIRLFTPVPNGVGPITIAMMLKNIWNAHTKQYASNI